MSDAHPQAPTSRLPGLDGLRALAIVAVVVYHLNRTWLPGGFLGVDLFFVISGFLITKLLLDQARSGRATPLRRIGDFYGRRARRILPATVLLVGVLIPVAVLSTDLVRIKTGDALAGLGFATNWWQIAQGWDYFAAWEAPSSLQHLWSLAIEEQFYLAWPALLTVIVLAARRRWTWVYATVAVLATSGALASAWWMYHLSVTRDIPYSTSASRVYYGTDTHASGILVGAAAAALFALAAAREPRHRHEPTGPVAGLRGAVELLGLAALGGLAYAALTVDEQEPPVYRGGFLVVALLSVVAIAAATRPWSRLGRALNIQPLRWIGLVSFELYLWHWPVGVAFSGAGVEPGLWPALTQAALMLALAGATHHWVTVPIWHPRPGTRPRAGVSALAAAAAAVVAVVLLLPSTLGGPAVAMLGRVPGPLTVPPPPSASPSPSPSPGMSSTPPPSTQSSPPGQGGSCTVPAWPPPVPANPLGNAALQLPITAFGDSVMNGATAQIEGLGPNVDVQAAGNRQPGRDIYPLVRTMQNNGTLGSIVVIQAGHNGRIDQADLNHLLDQLADRMLVVLMTVKLPPYPGQQNANNCAMVNAAYGRPNVTVANWLAAGNAHPGWFGQDGSHLTGSGRIGMAQLIGQAITWFDVPQPSEPTPSETPTPTESTPTP